MKTHDSVSDHYPVQRTDAERFADALDCDLYRLIRRAEEWGAKDKYWTKVAAMLREARPLVRVKMCAYDRDHTI